MSEPKRYSIRAMLNKSLLDGYGKAYIDDVIDASVTYDEGAGIYELTDEDFARIREKYASKPVKHEPKTGIKRIAHGAVGIAKAVAHIDRPDDATIAARLAVCEGCDEYKNGKCGKCGCNMKYKTAVAQEKCPLRKW